MRGFRTAVIVPGVVLLGLLAGCSTPAPQSSGVSTSAKPGLNEAGEGNGSFTDSYPLPDCTGQDPASCSYDGFDPAVDGFSFANWGGEGNLGATELIALFGKRAACAKVTRDGCVLYPAARQWAAQINESMAGGHCEGMAVMAARLFRGDAKPTDLDPAAAATFGLTQDDPDVARAIDVWFATQYLAPVEKAYAAFSKYQPSEIAAELAAGLQRGDGYTMGIYSEAGGHAVTPIAVTPDGDRIAVSVYDNNFPGTVQRIMIDPASEHWSYAMGSTNPDAPSDGWEGGVGTIDLTPMDSRALPAPAPFANRRSRGAAGRTANTSELLVTSPDPDARLGFMLTINGQTYDTTDPTVALPAGVVARSVLGAVRSGKGMKVSVDGSLVTSFKAAPTPANGGPAQPPVTMSVDSGSSPRVTLRQDADESGEDDASMSVDSSGSIDVAAADGADAEVNVSNGVSSVDFPLPDGIDMSVDPGEQDGVADVGFVDEDGNIVGTYEVDDETEDGSVVDSTAVFDSDSGDFDVTSEDAEVFYVSAEVFAMLVPGARYNDKVVPGVAEYDPDTGALILPDGYEEPEYYDESGSDSSDSTDESDGDYVEPDIIDETDSDGSDSTGGDEVSGDGVSANPTGDDPAG